MPEQIKIVFVVIGLFFSIFCLILISIYFFQDDKSHKILGEERIVRGDSLSPLIKAGQTIKVFFNYFLYEPIQKDDIVLVKYAGNKDPLIKIVKGLPKDTFSLQKAEDTDGYYIIINDKILKNSEGEKYIVDNRMLSLYVRDYKGVIPADVYLVLGNIPTGSLDATRFGLIDKSDIIAKVEYP